MPSVSAKQHRAMEAAKHGHSTLGIPQNVGAEFVAADKAAGKHFSNHPLDHGKRVKLAKALMGRK